MVAPSIEGTYQLTKRELPDGTVQHPPDVMGMVTFTKEFRNFNVVWSDDEGKFYSECYVARYKLTNQEYTETSEYLIVDDQIGGKEINYDLTKTTARSKVSIDGERISFALPQSFEQALSISVIFDGDSLTATGKDLFIDYWVRIS